MHIEFVPDHHYGAHGRERKGGNLSEVSRVDLRWYYFLGSLRIGNDEREIGPPWGWIPLFDILYCLRQVMVFVVGGDALGKLDFTENSEAIDFTVRDDRLLIAPTYQAGALDCAVDEFIAECKRFIRFELARVVGEYPALAVNPHVRELAITCDAELPMAED